MTFVKNTWYVAARSGEVGDTPLARTLLDLPIVLFRAPDGSATALLDACPHRAVPLSRGTIEKNGRIRCIYHGLEFDAEGVCRYNPHVAGPPDALRARRFPVQERYGLVWFWPGDEADADPALMPHYAEFDQAEGYVTGGSYTWVAASYLLMIDNLFDLSHAEYLHPGSVGTPGAIEHAQSWVEREDGGVKVHFEIPNLPPPKVWHAAWDRSEKVDQYFHMHWTGGGSIYMGLCVTPTGGTREEGWHLPFLHLVTPETQSSTHYFWCFARDFHLDNPELNGALEEVSGQAFDLEDKPILESVQAALAVPGVKLRNFSIGDSASAAIRRMIERQAEAELV